MSDNPPLLDGQHTIAIIGVGAKMPGALTAPAFWDNIRNGVYAIQDVPADRWDPALYWDPDPSVPDKTYSRIGGWVEGFEFDRKAFRLPPSVVEKIDPTQLMCLAAVREALEDAGYLDREFDRDRTAVILGNALGGDLRDTTNLRIQYTEVNAALRTALMEVSLGRLSDDEIETVLGRVETSVKDRIVGINEDSMPGELANIVAGRVAQTFDLRGPNYVCDAACASTLAALESAVFGLRARQFDMAVTGGADCSMGPTGFVKFSKIGALSATGSRPFDAAADGFVMGEGVGIIILKRLADAIEAGDQIYALIRGIAGSSDGRGKGITAPNPRGQMHSVRRAYQDAGVAPRTVSLVEAHGTSTPVGDPAEFESLRTVFDEDDTPVQIGAIGMGSVKSMIGHLKSAAAAASLVKVAFALRERTLPPTINVETPNPALKLDNSPFRLQLETQPWDVPANAPRRAAISAFGFGGTNFHTVLEEYDPEGNVGRSKSWSGGVFSASSGSETIMAHTDLQSGILGFAADSIDTLAVSFADFAARFERDGLAATTSHRLPVDGGKSKLASGPIRLSIAYSSEEELVARMARTQTGFERGKGWKLLENQGIYLSEEPLDGKIGMLFPGQGTQYLGMLNDLRGRFAAVDQTIAEADAIMTPLLGEPLSAIIYPAEGTDEYEAFARLTQTEITQPAVLTADIAIMRLLGNLGIEPAMVAGHSLGEYGACVASGVMSFEDALRTVARRGTAMAEATPLNGDNGLMAGVPMSAEEVDAVLATIDGYVVCANKNCSKQTIIAGLTEPVQLAVAKFEEMGKTVVLLPVSHAFHSKVVAAASEPLRRHLATINIQPPSTPILTNVTGDFYPEGPGVEDDIRDLLSTQVAAPVEFIALVERMYASGARIFVEVGPKRAQTSFVADILQGRPHVAMCTNHPKKGDIGSLFEALAQLWSVGAWSPSDEPDLHPTRVNGGSTPTATSNGGASMSAVSEPEALKLMIEILCDKTGYDPEEIEPEFELEADLGVDTVKQAEIMSTVRDVYGFAKDDDFRLAEYPTLNDLARYIVERVALEPGAAAPAQAAPVSVTAVTEVAAPAPVAAVGVTVDETLAMMIAVLCEKTGYDSEEIEPDFELEADLGVDTVKQAEIMSTVRDHYGFAKDDDFRLAEYPTLNDLARYIVERLALEPGAGTAVAAPAMTPTPVVAPALPVAQTAVSQDATLAMMIEVLCEKTGYDPDEIEPDFELEADLGVDTVKQAEIMSTIRDHYGFAKDDDFRLAEYPTLNDLSRYIVERMALEGGSAQAPAPIQTAPVHVLADPPAPPAMRAQATGSATNGARNWENPHNVGARVVITGCALGLPGTPDFLDDNSVDTLLDGENLIGQIPDDKRTAIVKKNILRLVKGKDGGGEMVPVDSTDDVLKLAGQMGAFDLNEFDVPERLIDSMDKTSQLAFAAGLLALRDAGLPLIPRFRTTTSGKQITVGWTLPEAITDETGVIYSTAFSGQDALVDEVTRAHTEPDYEFDHRFLLKVLGIANSRFAEYIGARGPNTKINNACASTTTAMAIAQDWIQAGRCKRVIILGADNVSGEELMEWVGAGFLATGAATTEGDVANAALPFDRRRNGIILGMGAMAMVLEAAGLPESRGIEPIADLLETRIANSAEHPTRLVPAHIASEVGKLIDSVEDRYKIDRREFAKRTVFVSHETYSPARGGSAQTEIESLRATFGEHASEVVIANTKGFTGHAMGAGIEEILALKALQNRRLPHIANFREPDPELGDLRLSEGGEYELDYALRLAAGFGSQLAVAVLRFRARTEDRVIVPERYEAWLRTVSGFEAPELVVENRTLRLREGEVKAADPQVSPAASAPQTDAAPATVRPTADPARFEQLGVVVEAHAAPAYDLGRLKTRLDGQRVAVVAGPLVVTELVVNALEQCGATVLVVEGEDSRNPLDVDFAICDLTDENALTRELRTFGSVAGVVNLLGFGTEKFSPNDVYRAARQSFHVARAWRFALDRTPATGDFFLSVTGMGGRLGFDRATGPLPVCGAVAGFTKALAREWQAATIRVLDVARRGFDPNLGLQLLWEGLFGGGIEIGLIGGVRYLPSTVRADELTPDALPSVAPTPEDVLVITGGAKGITAAVALNLAERYKCRLALVGRTPLTFDAPLAIDMAVAKAEAKAEILARGERATPRAVRHALAALESQRTIATNVERMRAVGSEVEYFSCDVADRESVEGMMAAVAARFGRIDGVIHGAGVEESRLIEDKDIRGFDRVFQGKALGAIHLWNAVESFKPSFFMTFSSVAGRFGNPGQVDYSAANEVLNKLVALLNATGKVRATSIDWTAWDEVGMAADGGMRMLLEARGVDLLPPDVGAPMVGDFLEAGLAGEFVVAGALGDFAMEEAPVAATHAGAPLIGEIISRTDDQVVVARTFSLEQDPFLGDHVYEGNPVVPGVMGFEMMVEAARLLIDEPAAVVRNVQFEHAIKLHRNEPVRLIATATRNGRAVDVTVETQRETKTGRIVQTIHYRAVVGFGETLMSQSFALDPTATLLEGPSRELIYQRYFHTGTFKVLDAVPVVGPDFVVGYGMLPTRRLTKSAENNAFATDPMVREMAFQVAGLWGMVTHGMSYLPYSIARAEQFGAALPNTPVCVRCKQREDADEHMIAFDVDVIDEDGRLLQRMEKVQLVGHRTLTADEKFPALSAPTVRTRRLDVARAEAVLARRDLTFDELVDAEERTAYDRLISERRRGEWLAARVAMKTFIADWVRDFTALAISPTEVRIRKDERRAPYIVLDQPVDLVMPAISITHSGGASIAALSPSRETLAIGIDLETVEQRDDAFARNYFSEAELELGADLDPATLHATLWSVKEAVSKSLGIGLQARLEEMEVHALTRVSETALVAEITLSGQAADAAELLGGTQLRVAVTLEANTVFSVATLVLDQTSRTTAELPQFERPVVNEQRAELEIAAIAALLVHRGLIHQSEVGLGGEASESEDLSAWKR